MVTGPLSWQSHLLGDAAAHDAPRHVVIVGGGTCAARRAAGFAREAVHVTVVATSICDGMRDVLLDPHVTWQHRALVPGDLDDAWLVLPATGDSASDAVVHRWVDRVRRRMAPPMRLVADHVPGATAS